MDALTFKAYGQPLSMVSSLRYLGRTLRHQLTEGTEGVGLTFADPGEVGSRYEEIRVFLNSGSPGESAIWVGDVGREGRDPLHGANPGGFHHRVARRITGISPQRQTDGIWNYFLLEEDMWGAGLEDMEVYIGRQQNTVAKYITTRPIMDLCLEEERRQVERVSKQWWEHLYLRLEGAQGNKETEGMEELEGAEE